RIGLINDNARSLRVDEIRRDNQAGGDDDGDEDSAEVHEASFSLVEVNVSVLRLNLFCRETNRSLSNAI
ncbi:MAG: hypothetical protein WCP19_10360, partial [Chloroflexota bacterium]